MSKIAIYPGSFDPITYGHIDVIERASELFSELIVVIAINSNKNTLFNLDERVEMAKESLKYLPNVKVDCHQGLTVDYARKVGAKAIIRGIRAVSDFEFEFQISLMNRKLESEVTTIFMMPNEKYTYLNSSIVRELAKYNQDTSSFVPDCVSTRLKEKCAS